MGGINPLSNKPAWFLLGPFNFFAGAWRDGSSVIETSWRGVIMLLWHPPSLRFICVDLEEGEERHGREARRVTR